MVRAEFTKFRTVRSWVIGLCAAAIMLVFVASLSAVASRASNPAVPTGPGGEAVNDAYTFVHDTLVGDGTLTARITALSGAYGLPSPSSRNGLIGVSSRSQPNAQLHPGLAPWAKAGVLLEPDTNQGTAYAAVMVTGSHGVQMQDNYTHDNPGLRGTVGPSSPRWLRLTRAGNLITGYDSTDGTNWTQIGTAHLTGLPHTVQIGLFATSPLYFAAAATDGTPSIATADVDQISTHGDLPDPSWTTDTIAGLNPDLPSNLIRQQRSADAFTISGSGDIAPLVGGQGPATHWAGASIVNGTIIALLIMIVLAALFVTSEYRRGLIHITITASPRRNRVLAAKAVVAGSLAFTAGAIATAIAEVITRRVLAAHGNYLFPQDGLTSARVSIGTGLLLGLTAVLVVALGTILRRGATTVAASTVVLILPGVLATTLATGADDWLMRATPTAAFAIQATLPRYTQVDNAYTIANGYFPISPWTGLAVLSAYTALALAIAMWLLRRRDA